MDLGKEKELCITTMVIDMRASTKMIKKKEKEYSIIIMVIEKWAIMMMVFQKEYMLFLRETVKLKYINFNYFIF